MDEWVGEGQGISNLRFEMGSLGGTESAFAKLRRDKPEEARSGQ